MINADHLSLVQHEQGTPSPSLFFKVFEQVCESSHDHTALIAENNQRWSYRALNEAANRMAHALIKLKNENNWPDGTLIGLFFENTPEAVAAILGVMKAGLAYLPLTTHKSLPPKRLTYYLKHSNITYLITQDNLLKSEYTHFIQHRLPKLLIDGYSNFIAQNKTVIDPAYPVDPNQRAYLIFSSGSTGIPKGIEIAHRGLCHPMEAVANCFKITPNDIIGWHSLLIFDASLLDIMTALGKGASCLIIPQRIRDGDGLHEYLSQHEVTIITLVPTVMRMINPADLPKLRGIISTGEAAQRDLFEQFLKVGRPLDSPRKVINGYGPSEVTICTSLAEYEPDKLIHLGQPINGLQWYLLTPATEDEPYPLNPALVTDDQVAELYISGIGLALRYIGEEHYIKRFREIQHPENSNEKLYIYQTGDIVKREADNTVVFINRMDAQEKIYGELVNAAEISLAISKFKINNQRLLSQNFTLIKSKDDNYLKFLHQFLYIDLEKITQLDINKLHFNLASHSLCNFIPSRYSIVSHIPKSVNGKVNKSEFPQHIKATFYPCFPLRIKPQSEVEKEVAAIWHEILDIPAKSFLICMDDCFDELGGVSIHRYQMLSRIYRQYPNIIVDTALFNANPTLRVLCTMISKKIKIEVTWISGQVEFNISNLPPLILIHSLFGDPRWDYRLITPELPYHWPVLSIKAPMLDFPGMALKSMSGLAKLYLSALRQTDKLIGYKGPFFYLCYSAGCGLGYEMLTLSKKQHPNSAIFMIDPPSPQHYSDQTQEEYANEIFEIMDGHFKQKVLGATHTILPKKELANYSKNKQLPVYWHKLIETLITKPAFEKEINDSFNYYLGIYTTIYVMSQIYSNYQPQPIDNVTLLAFTKSQKKRKNERLGWNKSLPMSLLTVSGEHLDIVSDSKIEWIKKEITPKIIEIYENFAKIYKKNQKKIKLSPGSLVNNRNLFSFSSSLFDPPRGIPVLWNVPFPNLQYMGRTEILNQIHDQLEISSNAPSIYLIKGISGIGKSQLAKQLANEFKINYNIVWWIDVETQLDIAYKKLATELKINIESKEMDDIISAVKDKLRQLPHWLLIFDNAHSQIELQNYLPQSHNKNKGHILITSDRTDWAYPSRHLDIFSVKEAVTYFQTAGVIASEKKMKALAIKLACFPLALTQAATYIILHQLKIEEYIEIYDDCHDELQIKEAELFSHEQGTVFSDNYQQTLAITVKASLDMIQLENNESYKLICLCAFLHSDFIPLKLLQGKLPLVKLVAITKPLKTYDLLLRDESPIKKKLLNSYSSHRAIQRVIIDLLERDERIHFLKHLLRMLGESYSLEELNNPDTFCPQIIPHLEVLYRHMIELGVLHSDFAKDTTSYKICENLSKFYGKSTTITPTN
ncbi:MAG: AMP-binding protein [Legionellales bacterium]|nr:AMP-binding protein [Legionellales bacterium]